MFAGQDYWPPVNAGAGVQPIDLTQVNACDYFFRWAGPEVENRKHALTHRRGAQA
jgi:hypothetical protein